MPRSVRCLRHEQDVRAVRGARTARVKGVEPMGQATVDLPDPLDAPPPSSLSGTDDLLAQLAGDEIDRLLAEADLEHKSLTAPALASPNPAPAPASETRAPAPTVAPATPAPANAPAAPAAA